MSGNFTTSFAAVSAQVQKIREQKQLENGTRQPSPQPQPQIQQQQQQQRASPTPTNQQPLKKQRLNAFNSTGNTNFNSSENAKANVRSKPASVQVNKSQTGNPLLQHLNNIGWSYVHQSSPFDYLTNSRRIVFLSLKYHKLHPEYFQRKLNTVTQGKEGNDAILIVVVDVENNDVIMKELSKTCIYEGVTMICAFGFQEAAKWIVCLAGVKI